MSNKLFRNIVAITLGSLIAAAGGAQSDGSDDPSNLPPGAKKQSSADALQADITLLAKGKRVSKKSVTSVLDFQERFLEYAQGLAARYPNELSRVWLEPIPSSKGYIQFTHSIPSETPPNNVMLLGGGRINREQHARRAELAADALIAKEYTNFLTYFDAALDKIRIEFVVEEGAPEPKMQDIFGPIQDHVRLDDGLFGDALVVLPTDLDLRIIRRSGPIYTLEQVSGGTWLRDDGVRECTGGWSVEGPNGDGIITAAHCVGLNEFEEPSASIYRMTWRDQERDKGDIEYHTTFHIELPEFFASATSIRDVESTKETLWMLTGNSVCVYGRSSNIRDCSHDIEATGVTVTFNDGVTVRKLVRASGDSSIGGDSGGGWSWNTEAWGVHSGSNGTVSYFTPVRRAERELNVDIMLAP